MWPEIFSVGQPEDGGKDGRRGCDPYRVSVGNSNSGELVGGQLTDTARKKKNKPFCTNLVK